MNIYYSIPEIGWHTENNNKNDDRNNNYLKPFGLELKGKKKSEMIILKCWSQF